MSFKVLPFYLTRKGELLNKKQVLEKMCNLQYMNQKCVMPSVLLLY